MAKRFGRPRWRRPERMLLDHGPIMRRKDLGVSEPIAVEPELARKMSRKQLQVILGVYGAACLVEGLAVGLAIGHPVIATVAALAYGFAYFFVAREFGDAWIVKGLRATTGAGPRVTRLATSEAATAGVPVPRLLVVDGDAPNALSFSLRRRWLVSTRASESFDEVALEGMLAHEIVHLRDGDSAVASLYAVLAGGPQLLARGAGALAVLCLPLILVPVVLRFAAAKVVSPPQRELRADVAAAMLTRYPPGLVTALGAAGGTSCGITLLDEFWFVSRGGSRAAEAPKRASLISEM